MKEYFGEKETWKGLNFWTDRLIEAGVMDELKSFSDVITGKEAPGGYGEPVLTDIVLDGKNCDIYHTDGKKGEESSGTGNRIFIHIKSELGQG